MPDTALDRVLDAVRCPVCGSGLARDAGRVTCRAGHAFDVARQGYVNLAVGAAQHGTADTADMVRARDEFLGRGFLAVVSAALVEVVARHLPEGDGLVVDVAGGTGHHLAVVLDAMPERLGLCLDLSTPALRRAARAHPRMAAVGADVWRGLPLADGCAAAVLSVFGPRNPAEIARVLGADGVLVVATPAPEHLGELVGPLGMLSVDPDKDARVAAALAGFTPVAQERARAVLDLDRATAVAAAAMGPAGQHASVEELTWRAEALSERTAVTVAVRVAAYRRG